MFERFDEQARQVVVLAQDEARAFKHNYIGTEHLLLGLLRDDEDLVARVLAPLGLTAAEVRRQVARVVGVGEEVATGQIPFTPRAKRVLELALREALSLGHNYVGTEHLLLGLLRLSEGVAAQILRDFDADTEKIRDEVVAMMSGRPPRHLVAPALRDPRHPVYRVETLVGGSQTWPDQLHAWGKEGWALVTIVAEGKLHVAILERRGRRVVVSSGRA